MFLPYVRFLRESFHRRFETLCKMTLSLGHQTWVICRIGSGSEFAFTQSGLRKQGVGNGPGLRPAENFTLEWNRRMGGEAPAACHVPPSLCG